ncbi:MULTISPECIES: hypothetical protein [unclassified Microcoleus]|uniref:hypothetical protein n=1 Tax=unclassified Microcoleus TaxID=2642155 RepID=UPI0025F96BFC|nr:MULTISPECIES: hypothetical protein [unclassified Microcoleus]
MVVLDFFNRRGRRGRRERADVAILSYHCSDPDRVQLHSARSQPEYPLDVSRYHNYSSLFSSSALSVASAVKKKSKYLIYQLITNKLFFTYL